MCTSCESQGRSLGLRIVQNNAPVVTLPKRSTKTALGNVHALALVAPAVSGKAQRLPSYGRECTQDRHKMLENGAITLIWSGILEVNRSGSVRRKE
eukprot:SAG31_NODE_1764_length_7320_cov_3.114112_1_plen_96_part_00